MVADAGKSVPETGRRGTLPPPPLSPPDDEWEALLEMKVNTYNSVEMGGSRRGMYREPRIARNPCDFHSLSKPSPLLSKMGQNEPSIRTK